MHRKKFSNNQTGTHLNLLIDIPTLQAHGVVSCLAVLHLTLDVVVNSLRVLDLGLILVKAPGHLFHISTLSTEGPCAQLEPLLPHSVLCFH